MTSGKLMCCIKTIFGKRILFKKTEFGLSHICYFQHRIIYNTKQFVFTVFRVGFVFVMVQMELYLIF